jgi:UDP-N-acetylglucosamine--N-acetylmuramyl-(pentapeptide) pyrophosphoryl-undecaprenol N-acetylglucosamine transferase
MTIVVTGGGSGGHITPILAVASELKKLQPGVRIVYIGQRGDSLGDIPAKDPNIDEAFTVSAGKFRRYHSEGLKQLLDIKTLFLNVRDVFRVIRGYQQSRHLLKKIKPDIVFVKGGFVGVPVGLAAGHLGISYITHDSDAIPGLANRIIAKRAAVHAVALPKEVYSYPPAKTVTVGVPVTDKYAFVTPEKRVAFKKQLHLAADATLLVIIGGGLGAQRVNAEVAEAMPMLLAKFPELQVVHGVGRANEADMKQLYATALKPTEQSRVVVKGFLHDVHLYSGAADVVITRAGATNLAEFAVQGKACIVLPNPFLTGGHQLKNAAYLEDQQAAVVVSETELEENPRILGEKVKELLQHPEKGKLLGKNFSKFGHANAAHDLAALLLDQIKQTSHETETTKV